MERNKYTREFKLAVANLLKEPGVSADQLAREVGVGQRTLRRWVRDASASKTNISAVRGQRKPDGIGVARPKQVRTKGRAEQYILERAIYFNAKKWQ